MMASPCGFETNLASSASLPSRTLLLVGPQARTSDPEPVNDFETRVFEV